ncbi:hypothetical protein Slin15195_G109860 [Septoria linicola]|uniref:Uncharacterized protein n=1 Tax=Septoria linicola TaxID=215465 RepID=A0A9Q9AXC1_9PEZI|nr:hypothetical protein Slin15195_G109860 [Septoria linicola]
MTDHSRHATESSASSRSGYACFDGMTEVDGLRNEHINVSQLDARIWRGSTIKPDLQVDGYPSWNQGISAYTRDNSPHSISTLATFNRGRNAYCVCEEHFTNDEFATPEPLELHLAPITTAVVTCQFIRQNDQITIILCSLATGFYEFWGTSGRIPGVGLAAGAVMKQIRGPYGIGAVTNGIWRCPKFRPSLVIDLGEEYEDDSASQDEDSATTIMTNQTDSSDPVSIVLGDWCATDPHLKPILGRAATNEQIKLFHECVDRAETLVEGSNMLSDTSLSKSSGDEIGVTDNDGGHHLQITNRFLKRPLRGYTKHDAAVDVGPGDTINVEHGPSRVFETKNQRSRKTEPDYTSLCAHQIEHYGDVYPTVYAVLTRPCRPYIHASCGQGYAHPKGVKVHHQRCSNSGRAWNEHSSCWISTEDMNIVHCKDGYIIADKESYDKLEKAIRAGMEFYANRDAGRSTSERQDHAVSSGMDSDISAISQGSAPDVEAAKSHASQDYRQLHSTQVRHFGSVYHSKRAVFTRTGLRPYIHAACGQNYAHPHDVKKHSERHQCPHNSKFPWYEHPSCKVGYDDLALAQCQDGWVFLDEESHDKLESAIAAGKEHVVARDKRKLALWSSTLEPQSKRTRTLSPEADDAQNDNGDRNENSSSFASIFTSTSSEHDYTSQLTTMIEKALLNRVGSWAEPEALTGNVTKLLARKRRRSLHVSKTRKFDGSERRNVEAALVHMCSLIDRTRQSKMTVSSERSREKSWQGGRSSAPSPQSTTLVQPRQAAENARSEISRQVRTPWATTHGKSESTPVARSSAPSPALVAKDPEIMRSKAADDGNGLLTRSEQSHITMILSLRSNPANNLQMPLDEDCYDLQSLLAEVTAGPFRGVFGRVGATEAVHAIWLRGGDEPDTPVLYLRPSKASSEEAYRQFLCRDVKERLAKVGRVAINAEIEPA